MDLKISSLIGLLVIIFPSIVCHVYKAEVWKRGENVCYCLGDVHESEIKKNRVNNNNRRDVLYAAKAINALVVIEDKEGVTVRNKICDGFGAKIRESVQGSKCILHLYDLLIPHHGMLRGTSGLCYRAGIDVENIEFRFLAASDGNLKLKDELSYLAIRVEKILNYDDENLKSFYSSVVKSYRDIVKKEGKIFFDYLVKKDKQISPYDISCAPYNTQMDASYKKIFPESNPRYRSSYNKKELLLCLYKSFLIDAEIARAIAQSNNNNRVIVCAGGDHITGIAPALKAMGYERIDVLNGENPDKAEPDAIDLDAFFAKHEPKYAAGEFEKTYIHRMLDMQCYFDKHPLVMVATGLTTVAALFVGVITCPAWCAAIAIKLAPKNPKACLALRRALVSAVMAATVMGFYKALAPIRELH